MLNRRAAHTFLKNFLNIESVRVLFSNFQFPLELKWEYNDIFSKILSWWVDDEKCKYIL